MERNDTELTNQQDNPHGMVDLHGLSLLGAERVVSYWLATAASKGIDKIRFVTGRGNHINAKGERGTLYKNFLQWVEQSPFNNRIESCNQHDGYFEIFFKARKPEPSTTKFFVDLTKKVVASNIEAIQSHADQGEAYFQMLYAHFLEKGEIIAQDFKKAAHYYRLAADQNYPAAIHELARCFLHGIGVRQNDKAAVDQLLKAHKLEYIESTLSLGDCYWRGHGVKQDGLTAVSYYAKAAAAGHLVGMRKLASAYNQGIGVKKDQEKAFIWYKKSADLGNTLAQYNVAVMYQNGTGTKINNQLAFYYFSLAAKEGDPDAQFFLGQCYFHGDGTDKDPEKANYWFKLAANHGSAQASHWLSEFAKDSSKAHYLQHSAHTGNFLDKIKLQATQEKLSISEIEKLMQNEIKQASFLRVEDIILLEDESKFLLIDSLLSNANKKQKNKALTALKTMAEQGCPHSLRRLGLLHFHGFNNLNIQKDILKTQLFWQQAADLDDALSMCHLGSLYEHSLGVPSNPAKALALYKKAAELGNPSACHALGIVYTDGLLEQQPDFDKARKYLELAICYELKLAQSKNKLGFGLLDKQESVLESASALLEELDKLNSTSQEKATPIAVAEFSTDIVEQQELEEQANEEEEEEQENNSSVNQTTNRLGCQIA